MPMPRGHMVLRRGRIDGLSDQETQFVRAYLQNGGNATEAAREAGYNNPAVAGSRTIRKQKITEAIASHVLPRVGRIMHSATDLIEKQLAAWTKLVADNPASAAMLPTKELRGLLQMGMARLLPAPEPVTGQFDGLGADTVEDLEARLNHLLTARSAIARVIGGDADVIEDASTNPAQTDHDTDD